MQAVSGCQLVLLYTAGVLFTDAHYVGVCKDRLFTLFAVKVAAAFSYILVVIGSRTKVQMQWIATRWIIAGMANAQNIWFVVVVDSIRNAMSVKNAPVDTHTSVAKFCAASGLPFPTTRGQYLDAIPERLDGLSGKKRKNLHSRILP